MAATGLGINKDELIRRKAEADVMNTAEAEPFHRELAKIACAAFEAAEDTKCPEARLFSSLVKSADWHTSYHKFTDCVLRALGRTNFEKSAAPLLPAVSMLHDRAGGDMLKTITAGGALSGAALGSIAFLLSRNANQTSSENAALLEKIRAYKQLKMEIQEDMGSEGVMTDAGKEERYDV